MSFLSCSYSQLTAFSRVLRHRTAVDRGELKVRRSASTESVCRFGKSAFMKSKLLMCFRDSGCRMYYAALMLVSSPLKAFCRRLLKRDFDLLKLACAIRFC